MEAQSTYPRFAVRMSTPNSHFQVWCSLSQAKRKQNGLQATLKVGVKVKYVSQENDRQLAHLIFR